MFAQNALCKTRTRRQPRLSEPNVEPHHGERIIMPRYSYECARGENYRAIYEICAFNERLTQARK